MAKCKTRLIHRATSGAWLTICSIPNSFPFPIYLWAIINRCEYCDQEQINKSRFPAIRVDFVTISIIKEHLLSILVYRIQ